MPYLILVLMLGLSLQIVFFVCSLVCFLPTAKGFCNILSKAGCDVLGKGWIFHGSVYVYVNLARIRMCIMLSVYIYTVYMYTYARGFQSPIALVHVLLLTWTPLALHLRDSLCLEAPSAVTHCWGLWLLVVEKPWAHFTSVSPSPARGMWGPCLNLCSVNLAGFLNVASIAHKHWGVLQKNIDFQFVQFFLLVGSGVITPKLFIYHKREWKSCWQGFCENKIRSIYWKHLGNCVLECSVNNYDFMYWFFN